MEKLLLVYHDECWDGLGALWAGLKHVDSGEYVIDTAAGNYSYPTPPLEDWINKGYAAIYFLDFCYARDIMEQVRDITPELIILDHHKTAVESMEGFASTEGHTVETVFDMERSGACITWDWFSDYKQPAPQVLKYIEDRDLWRNSLPSSETIVAFIHSNELVLETIDKCNDLLSTVPGMAQAAQMGQVLLAQKTLIVRESVRMNKTYMFIGGKIVPAVNSPGKMFVSETAMLLAEDKDAAFGVAWFVDGSLQATISLRSIGDFDVSEIAKLYGGGGHKNSAGFTVSLIRLPHMFVGETG